ncbi:MAG: serine/threonine protein kinase [Myxococcales bacterium]|nr:serine/threonine protein kinase [Myxococcales bacterium]
MSVVVSEERQIRCCTRCLAIYRKDVAFCPSDGGEIEFVDHDPLLGTDLEHYVIDALLGEGAMGRVYRAHHKTLAHKQFALKVLLGDLASTQAMRMRFVNEAKSAGQLSHPNVVSVVDFGRSSAGLIYLVMELVDGIPLSTMIEAGPLEPMRAAKLARDVAAGLQHAHGLGLIHRDLKPENVIVVSRPDGEVPRVVDFGIALSIERTDVRLTSTGMAMGTPAYVAPEQVSGNEIDARADQYALGVTLYECLTGGRLPFMGDPMDVVAAKIGNEAPALAEQMPEGTEVPPGLARIVQKMVARRPKLRFDDLGEVIEALDRWINSRGVDTDVLTQPPPPKRRRGAVVAVALLAVAGTATAWVVTRPPAASSNTAATTSPAPAPAPKVAVAAAPPAPIETAPAAPTETAPPAPIADPPVPLDDPPAPVEDPPTPKVRPSGRRTSRGKPVTTTKARDRKIVTVAAATPAPPSLPSGPTPPITAPPRPDPEIPLQARVLGVDVQGSLSQAVIQRAVDRVRPAVERCTASGSPHTVRMQFTIDESRRAHGVRGSGSTQASVACLASALGGVRTEAAPDTGDVEVVVRISFGTRS